MPTQVPGAPMPFLRNPSSFRGIGLIEFAISALIIGTLGLGISQIFNTLFEQQQTSQLRLHAQSVVNRVLLDMKTDMLRSETAAIDTATQTVSFGYGKEDTTSSQCIGEEAFLYTPSNPRNPSPSSDKMDYQTAKTTYTKLGPNKILGSSLWYNPSDTIDAYTPFVYYKPKVGWVKPASCLASKISYQFVVSSGTTGDVVRTDEQNNKVSYLNSLPADFKPKLAIRCNKPCFQLRNVDQVLFIEFLGLFQVAPPANKQTLVDKTFGQFGVSVSNIMFSKPTL
jgi:type II secretory pathway component PulJ